MLLFTSASGKCVLLGSASCDAESAALIEQRLGRPIAEVVVVASDASPVLIGGVERVPETIVNILGADMFDRLEYVAYDKVERLLSQTRPGRTRNCILAGYHEFASLITCALRIGAVATAGRAPFIMLVDWRFLESVQAGPAGGVRIEPLVPVAPRDLRPSVTDLLSRLLRKRRPASDYPRPLEAALLRAGRWFGHAFRNRGFSRLGLRFRWLLWRTGRALDAVVFKCVKPIIVFIINHSHWAGRWVIRHAFVQFKALTQGQSRLLAAAEKHRKQKQARQRLGQGGGDQLDAIVMAVQDSGTRVNLDPAKAIAREFRSRGVFVTIVTEARLVAEEFMQEGYMAVLVGGGFWRSWLRPAPNPPHQLTESDGLAITLPKRVWRHVFRRHTETQFMLKKIDARIRVAAVLSINETLPVSVSSGLWARARGRPWIGHFPILLGKRADCYYFPADQHLAYGEQLRDHMMGAGVAANTIEVVGSFTYDKHRTRDRKADRLAVEKSFPRTRNVKLVTVATENLPDCDIEMIPVLSAVCAMPGVHVVLKLHPEDSLDYFERLAERLRVRDRIDIVKKYPLGELLGASDLLICIMSNIVIEAGVTGTPTLMCDFSGKARVLDFAAEGLCMPCKSASELPEILGKLLSDESYMQMALQRMHAGLRRFNGPNDGRSTQRIVDYVVARAGLACAVDTIASGQPSTMSDGRSGAGESGASQDTVTMAR